MRPGFRLVVDLLRGQPTPAPSSQQADEAIDLANQQHILPTPAPSSQQADEAIDLANQQHILPTVLTALRSHGDRIAPAVRDRIQSMQRDLALASFWWTSELKGILRAFAEADVDVVLLKGPSLAERLFGDVTQRTCRDLDLLVRRRDLVLAEALLTRLAFVPDARPDDYHRAWRRGSTGVELHIDVENPLAIDIDIVSAWDRTLPSHFGGQPCRILSPADELLFLCLHGVRHRYDRLSLVLDVARGFSQLGPALGPAAFQTGAPARLKHLVVLGAAMASHLDPALPLPPGLTLEAAHTQHLHRIADRLWQELEAGNSTHLDWTRQHSFYLELEPTLMARTAARLRLSRILATRLIEEDFAFARRLGVSRPALVWLLRQLRLATKLTRTP